MADFKNVSADIELANTFTNEPERAEAMPRMDTCHNCGKVRSGHAEGKCLFDASTFAPRDRSYQEFRTEFMRWACGQKIEDALCNIVYELTRGDR